MNIDWALSVLRLSRRNCGGIPIARSEFTENPLMTPELAEGSRKDRIRPSIAGSNPLVVGRIDCGPVGFFRTAKGSVSAPGTPLFRLGRDVPAMKDAVDPATAIPPAPMARSLAIASLRVSCFFAFVSYNRPFSFQEPDFLSTVPESRQVFP